MPSCAESHAGSIAVGLSAGLIPIVSEECGYDDEDEVINLPDCQINTIRDYVLVYSEKTIDWVEAKALKCVQVARTKYSRNNYSNAIRIALESIIENHV